MVSNFEPKVVLCLLLLRALAFSQNPGANVSGTVTDPAGAVVPAAHVEARNVVTGIVSTTLTNEAGVYVFVTLNPGIYQITAEHPGFQKYSLSDLNLEVGAKLAVNINLKVGATTDTVEVRAGAAQELA